MNARERGRVSCEEGSEISVLMIVGSIRSYKFDRSDRLLTPIGPIRPELTENFHLVVYCVSLKLMAVIKFNYR